MKTKKNILVIGPSGAGKTFTVGALKKQHSDVFEAEEVENLTGFYDTKGNQVAMPREASKKWLESYPFLWQRSALEKLMQDHERVIIFGLSENIFEMADLFDKVFYLDLPDNIILERLERSSRKNPFGSTNEQKQRILHYEKVTRKKAKDLKIPFIDATMSPKDIYKEITQGES